MRFKLISLTFAACLASEVNTLRALPFEHIHLLSSGHIQLFESGFLTKEIDAVAHNAIKTFNVPGAAIAIVVNDQVLLSRGYGTSSIHEGLPVTEHTLFPIASCTKAFTALVLGQLAEEGILSLDDPVKTYIPEFCLFDQNRTFNLTIRDLLAHRTGIARHDPLWFSQEISRQSIIALLQHLEPVCELRQEYQYNNLMYSIAGIVIERVTGQSWEEVVAERIFTPLEMIHSNTSLQQLQESADYSLPHAEIEDSVITVPFRNGFPINPGGGIHANVADMANWLKLQLAEGVFSGRRIVQRHTLQEQHSVQMPMSSSTQTNEVSYPLGYGLGWLISKYRGFDLINHLGNIDGFTSEAALLPEKRLGIVILTNSGNNGRYVISAIRNHILDRFLNFNDIDWMKKNQETYIQVKALLQGALKSYHELSLQDCPHSLEAFAGSYTHPSYGNMEIAIDNGHLLASFGIKKIPLYFKKDNIFVGQYNELLFYGANPNIDFTFMKDASGSIYKVEVPFEGFRGAKPITFIRVSNPCSLIQSK